MRQIMDCLLAMQELQLDGRRASGRALAEVERLRAGVPPVVLAHYDRFVARGKRAVALARNGVCGACHLRIITGKVVKLSAGIELQKCDNCGRYLSLEEELAGTGSQTEARP